MKTFIFYDITDDKIRDKIVSLLFDYNFQRIQFSVFLGEKLSEKAEKKLLKKADFLLSNCNDAFYLFNISDKNFNKFNILSTIEKDSFINSSFFIY